MTLPTNITEEMYSIQIMFFMDMDIDPALQLSLIDWGMFPEIIYWCVHCIISHNIMIMLVEDQL